MTQDSTCGILKPSSNSRVNRELFSKTVWQKYAQVDWHDIKRHLGIPQLPHHPTIFVESNLIVQSFFVDSFEEKQEGGLFGVLLTKQSMDHNVKSRDS